MRDDMRRRLNANGLEPSERRTEIRPHVRQDDPIRCAAAKIRDGLSGDCA
jgi:hypothetical protein